MIFLKLFIAVAVSALHSFYKSVLIHNYCNPMLILHFIIQLFPISHYLLPVSSELNREQTSQLIIAHIIGVYY